MFLPIGGLKEKLLAALRGGIKTVIIPIENVKDLAEIPDNVNSDASQGTPMYVATYSANPDIKMAITDHGGLTASLPTYMKAAGHGTEEVCGAGFDLSAPIVDGINSGYIDVVIDQQPFIQGYMPIVQLFLSTKYGMAGLAMDTGAAFVTADNVDAVAPLAAVQIR